MTDKQKQIYRFGQMYGYICSKNTRWSGSAHDSYAARFPFKGFTAAYMAAVKAHVIEPSDTYIMCRMDCIDPEFDQDKSLTLVEQGVWSLGRLRYKRDIKTLIDHTGMTQAQLADKLGVTALTVGRWYRGEVPPKEQVRYAIEEIVLDSE